MLILTKYITERLCMNQIPITVKVMGIKDNQVKLEVSKVVLLHKQEIYQQVLKHQQLNPHIVEIEKVDTH